MENYEEEMSCFDLPEDTPEQIIKKISAMGASIQSDWSDPRDQCREIGRLCQLLQNTNSALLQQIEMLKAVIRDMPEKWIDITHEYKFNHSEDHFYRIKKKDDYGIEV